MQKRYVSMSVYFQISIIFMNRGWWLLNLKIWWFDEMWLKRIIQLLKSEVAIVSLFRQIQQTKNFLLQVKTTTKSPGNGIAESVKSCNLHKKGSFKA